LHLQDILTDSMFPPKKTTTIFADKRLLDLLEGAATLVKIEKYKRVRRMANWIQHNRKANIRSIVDCKSKTV